MAFALAITTLSHPAEAQLGRSNRLPPSAPENLQVSVNASGQVTATWEDTSETELGFRLIRERRLSPTTYGEPAGFTVGANVTGYSERPEPGVYRYRLRAYNRRGNSSYTPWVVAEAAAASPPPLSPGAFTILDAGDGVARLTWVDRATNEASYELERQPMFAGGSIKSLAADTVQFEDETIGGTFAYRIRAVNEVGPSDWSPWTRKRIDMPGGSSAPRAFPAVVPGPGFTGPTEQPAAVGVPGQPGFDAKAIARWDVVPFQTFDSDFHIGVVAFHMNGIAKVDFSCNGGPWTSVHEMQLNPRTGVWEYTALLRASDFRVDGPVEIRAVAWPVVGEPRVLTGGGIPKNGEHALTLYANPDGSLTPGSHVHVSLTGDDANDGSAANPVQTLVRAITRVQPGGTIILVDPGTYHITDVPSWSWYTGAPAKDTSRWITIRPADGLTREQIVISQPVRDNFRPTIGYLRWYNVTFDFKNIRQYYPVRSNYVWFDNVRFTDTEGWAVSRLDAGLQPIHTSIVSFATNSNSYDMIYGLVEFQFLRSCHVERISGDAYQQSRLILNCTARTIDGRVTEHHTDLYQTFGPHENTIVYGLSGEEMYDVQTLFLQPTPPNSPPAAVSNSAFVDVIADQADPTGLGGPPFSQLQGRFEHVLFRNLGLARQRMMISPSVDATNVFFENATLHALSFQDYVQGAPPPGIQFNGCR